MAYLFPVRGLGRTGSRPSRAGKAPSKEVCQELVEDASGTAGWVTAWPALVIWDMGQSPVENSSD